MSPKIPWECTLRNKALGLLSSVVFVALGMFWSLCYLEGGGLFHCEPENISWGISCETVVHCPHLSCAGFGAVYAVWRGSQFWMKARQKHQQEVYHYVERIIEYLSSQHQSPGETTFVPVIHVRDQLIPPQSRESKLISSYCITNLCCNLHFDSVNEFL